MANVIAKIQSVPLVNGTPVLLTYVCPTDGNYHSVEVQAAKVITSTETGGAINVVMTDLASGKTSTSVIFAGAGAAGLQNPAISVACVLSPGSTVVVNQSSALTAGASSVSVFLDVSDPAIPG